MNTNVFSAKIRMLISSEMAAGQYKSEDALLVEALKALADRRAAIVGIRRGLDDMQAGKIRSRGALTRRLLKRHPYLADS